MQFSFNSSRIFAPPITSGPFTFDGHKLEVDRSPRCDSKRLYDLLTYVDPGPVLTKAGKPRKHQPPPHKDETGSFYEAQLVHHGLKRLKTKAAAKKALLAAFKANGGKLDVPPDIQDLEQQLKARFADANSHARQKYEKEKAHQKLQQQQKQLKRKREGDQLMAEVSKAPKPARSISRDLTQLQGFYTISALAISDGWDCHGPLTLRLGLSSTRSHLWGSFDFGVFEGKLRSCAALKINSETIKFQWRGRETGEGESTLGKENVAIFRFLEGGRFSGSMYWNCAGTFEIAGKKDMVRSKNNVWSMNIPTWKSKFYELNQENYDAESEERWGGFYHRRSRREPDSDTEDDHDDEGDEGEGEDDESGDDEGEDEDNKSEDEDDESEDGDNESEHEDEGWGFAL